MATQAQEPVKSRRRVSQEPRHKTASNPKCPFREAKRTRSQCVLLRLMHGASTTSANSLFETLKNDDQMNYISKLHTRRLGDQRHCREHCSPAASASPSIWKSSRCAFCSCSSRVTTSWYGFSMFQQHNFPEKKQTYLQYPTAALPPCSSSLSARDVPGGKTRNFALADTCRRRNGCKNAHKPRIKASGAGV